GSTMGSLYQGVRRFCRLFRLQVVPAPDSLTRQPKRSFATTLTHGMGGRSPSTRMTYSRPSDVKPPYPLSRRSGVSSPRTAGSGLVGRMNRVGRTWGGGGSAPDAGVTPV